MNNNIAEKFIFLVTVSKLGFPYFREIKDYRKRKYFRFRPIFGRKCSKKAKKISRKLSKIFDFFVSKTKTKISMIFDENIFDFRRKFSILF